MLLGLLIFNTMWVMMGPRGSESQWATAQQVGEAADPSVNSATAQTPSSGKAGSAEKSRDGFSTKSDTGPATGTMSIPTALPDGRRLIPIGMYQSQMDELVPEDYRPVSIDQLNEAVAKWTARATDDQTSRLKDAIYWVQLVGDTLVSDRSILNIESDRTEQVRRSLGKVNLAVEQPRGLLPGTSVLPRLESEADGNLVAVFRGDGETDNRFGIEYKWRLRGTKSGNGYVFKMQFPRAPQARFVFSAPPGISIRSDDGVLRSRPDPPPDASQTQRSSDLRWYELDAGGLDLATIHAHPEVDNASSGSFVVRRSDMEYKADRSGLTWTSKMVVQLPEGQSFPNLVVGGTTVTSIKVRSEEIPFSSSVADGRVRQLRLNPSDDLLAASDAFLDVVVTGYTRWNERSGWCNLPMPVWDGDAVIHAAVVDDAVVSVRDPLRVIAWELPDDWQQSGPQMVDDGVTTLSAQGPAFAPRFGVGQAKRNTSAGGSWSRVQVVDRSVFPASETALRLNVADSRLLAKARIAIKLDSDRIEPVRLLVEEDWTCESITLLSSGRVIESPKVNGRVIVVWPETDDISNSSIVLEAEGIFVLERELPENNKDAGIRATATRVPASWFLRPSGVRGQMIAAVMPPKNLNWSGEVAMQRDSVDQASLTEEQRQFFSGLSPETLWFRPVAGRTPELLLLDPSVAFNATTLFDVRRVGDEVVETLQIEIESDGQSLKNLQVRTGSLEGRGPYLWSISDSGDASTIGLPASDVSATAETYSIDVSDRNLRGKKLIATRRYSTPDSLKMKLPNVSGASSQSAEAIIGVGLLVSHKPLDVQQVPAVLSPRKSGEAVASDFGPDGEANIAVGNGNDMETMAVDGSTRLRYDTIQLPVITVKRSDVNPNVTIVWREQISVEASSRGTDRIEAVYRVSPTAPLIISYEPDLQLESVERDNEPVDLMTILRRPLVLEPRSDTESIRVVWNRSQYGSSWLRDCKFPKIDVSGTVLKSEHRLVAASDTFAPIALIRGEQASQGVAAVVAMRLGESVILVRRNVALAMGWLLALLVFALCWFISERSPYMVTGLVVVFTAILFLWWPWKLAIIGWLIIPAITAATLATARHWYWFGESGHNGNGKSPTGGLPGRRVEDASYEFSVESAAKIIGVLIAVSLFLSAMVTAQEGEQTQVPPSTAGLNEVKVLVPMDQAGKRLGSMVYIPGSVHTQLFKRVNRAEPKNARIAWANYRVTLEPELVETDRIEGLVIEAEYLIHLEDGERGANVVRLPIAAKAIRTLELVSDVSRIIRFEADRDGWAIATLPAGVSARIRVALIPTVSTEKPWVRVALGIPPVASSGLVVESEQNVSALRVGGRLLEETELRRWTEELGPRTELEIEFRTLLTAKTEIPRKLGRRYRVNAGRRQVTIDCEVDPPGLIAEGEAFQFDIRDAAMPRVTSRDWRLDSSELKSPSRRQMILTCLKDNPSPIGLLWTQAPPIADEQSGESGEIQIPEVTATFGENGDPWLALYSDSTLQFDSLDAKSSDSFSVDDFNGKWQGYPEKINHRSYVISGDLPSLVLRAKATSPPTVTQQHDLRVVADRLELSYSASLTLGADLSQRYSLRVPRRMELLDIMVNGIPLSEKPIAKSGYQEIPLGSFPQASMVEGEVIQISAIAVQRLRLRTSAKPGSFSPPRITLEPDIATLDQYMISHDRSTTLTAIELPLQKVIEPLRSFTEQSLADGWIPEATWFIPPGTNLESNSLGGLYEVAKRTIKFDCDQKIVLDRVGGLWNMKTTVKFLSAPSPEFIDVEIPTRWCGFDTLSVENSTLWTKQPSADPSRQIIRIAFDSEEIIEQGLVIRGQLMGAESARVSVPPVRVLGIGLRRVTIDVPKQLGNENLQWRKKVVKAVGPETAGRVMLRNIGSSWSVDLAPLPEVDVAPELFGCDVEVFPQNDGILVLSHWDLFPGGLDSVVVNLPPDTKLLAAWAAGRAVVAEPVQSSSNDQQSQSVRVPLALTRLGQPIELLLEASASAAKRGDYLPNLKEIPVSDRWVANFGAGVRKRSSSDSMPERLSERGLAIARSAVESVESLDRLSQRPGTEIAAWLQLWLKRYRMIAEASGHQVQFGPKLDLTETTLASPSNLKSKDQISSIESLQWQELDARMGVFVARFLSEEEILDARDAKPFLFDVGGFDGFHPQRITHLVGNGSGPTVQVASGGNTGLRNLIVNGITLIVIMALLTCVGPLRRFIVPVVSHPAFWLALVGVFGFAVAPVPVAGAILLVAISLPVFPTRRSSLSS